VYTIVVYFENRYYLTMSCYGRNMKFVGKCLW